MNIADLESRIEQQANILVLASSPTKKRAAWKKLTELIARRSPTEVRRMEISRGLIRAERKSYGEKLKDPRWQRKRLEVMHRADFTCEKCGDPFNTLNVHHVKYRKDAEPWEYSSAELICLCETCHKSEHTS
jgi:5-methylcytosine-specific restriction endonuclease McrA